MSVKIRRDEKHRRGGWYIGDSNRRRPHLDRVQRSNCCLRCTAVFSQARSHYHCIRDHPAGRNRISQNGGMMGGLDRHEGAASSGFFW
jgi:hypothetical protein